MGAITRLLSFFMPFLLSICFAGSLHSEPINKPIKIVFSTYWPTSYEYLWLPVKHFAERVEKRSNGRVKFKLHHSKKLFN